MDNHWWPNWSKPVQYPRWYFALYIHTFTQSLKSHTRLHQNVAIVNEVYPSSSACYSTSSPSSGYSLALQCQHFLSLLDIHPNKLVLRSDPRPKILYMACHNKQQYCLLFLSVLRFQTFSESRQAPRTCHPPFPRCSQRSSKNFF